MIRIHHQIAFGFLLATLAACSPNAPMQELSLDGAKSTAVVNGEPVKAGTSLSKKVLFLSITSKELGESWSCSATALSKRIILTAAHCLPYEASKASVVLTESQSKTSERVEIQGVIRHEAFGSVLEILQFAENDIALAILKSDLPSSVEITELYDGKSLYDKGNVLISGYGLTEKDPVIEGARSPHKDFHGTLNVGTTILEESYRTILSLSSESTSHGCPGDSGGPAFITTANGNLQQIGVFSRMSSADCLGKSLYESTIAQADWLRYNIAKLDFVLKVRGQKTTMAPAVSAKIEELDKTVSKRMIEKILKIMSNEYFEYVCTYEETKPSDRDTSGLFEALTKNIESASLVKLTKTNGELQLKFSHKQNTVLLSTTGQQTFIPVIQWEKATSSPAKEKVICKGAFVNLSELE
ncbi:MAG: S1 family peptidase [Bdellovibrio sp.]